MATDQRVQVKALDEVVEWLNDTLSSMTESEIAQVASPSVVLSIQKIAERAADILEGANE